MNGSQSGCSVGYLRVAILQHIPVLSLVCWLLQVLFEKGFPKDVLFLVLTQYSAEG